MSNTTAGFFLSEGNECFPVIGVGASAGGLESFRELIAAIPETSGMTFILMQHLDPTYETALTDILQRETAIKVLDLTDDLQLLPDHIYVMPSNKLLVSNNGILQIESRPVSNKHPLYSIDIFFSALAEIFQSRSIGILLSGMGSDGTLGLKRIKDDGGVTFVQTPGTAKYPDMPQHAIDEDVVNFVLEPKEIPAQLMQVGTMLRSLPATEEQSAINTGDEMHYSEIIAILRKRRDVDFTYYKQTTIRRRILRRMVVNRMHQLADYVAFLQLHVAEQDTLYQDLLIPVTSFFRDSAIFSDLCSSVFPELFKDKPGNAPVRIWVAGCSTGEEAYSIAICIHEYLGIGIAKTKLQLFATDLSEKAIQKARTGIYSRREIDGISEEQLKKYFIKTDEHYLVKKEIRDLCVFAAHNFLKDPPFAKMDFITCRNVMIYMESYLQKKALSTFHYALNEKGLLLLGKSETAASSTQLFEVIGKKYKLYIRKDVPGRISRLIPEIGTSVPKTPERPQPIQHRKDDFHKNADDILLSKYTPSGVVVNEHFEIVQFRGSTGSFLEAAPGKASLNILKMARDGLSFEIRNALHKVRENKETVVKRDILISNGKTLINIEVIPLLQTIEPHYLILFTETSMPAIESPGDVARMSPGKQIPAENNRIMQLEKDLLQLREDMRTITEDQEATNEELQSANEELLSGSEELQSLNEELETSKEELQSTNEELMTVNQELYGRNDQYNQARLYAEAIISTINEPLLVLNRDLRVKSANQSFYDYFKFTEDAIAGKILFELQDNLWNIPGLRTHLLDVQTLQVDRVEWEVTFALPGMGERIFVLNASIVNPGNSEQLILLAFDDITLRQQEENSLREQLTVMEKFFQTAPAFFCILRGPNHIFQFANPSYLNVSGAGINDLRGKTFAAAFPELNNEGYKFILDKVFKTGEAFYSNEMKANHYPGKAASEEVYIDLSVQAYRDNSGRVEGILFFSYEVTEKVLARRQVEKDAIGMEAVVHERTALLREANNALELSNRNLQAFASIASHDLQEPLRKIKTFSGILFDRYSQYLPAEAISLLNKTDESANRMSKLITGVLNYSRIEFPQSSFVATDLDEVLKNVIDDFDLAIAEKEAVIKVSGRLPVIDAVPSQMNQLFYNLVSNALKFVSKERKPDLVISCVKLSQEEISGRAALLPEQDYYQFIFKDNGIGFEEQFSEQIFAVFERLNSLNEFEGTGIGLALCRKIIENHHGLIWAEGVDNVGASIFLILPVKQSGTTIAAVNT